MQPSNSNGAKQTRFPNCQNSTGHYQNSTGQPHNQNSIRQVLNGQNQPTNGRDSTGQPFRTPRNLSGQQQNGLQSQHSSAHLRHQQNVPYPQPSEVMQLVSRTKVIEERINRVEEQNFSIKECLDSVKDLLEKHLQQSFKIRGGTYEVNR